MKLKRASCSLFFSFLFIPVYRMNEHDLAVGIHINKIGGVTLKRRIEKLLQWMEKQQVDAVWIHSPENLFYFTGCPIEPHERLVGLFLFRKDDPIFIFPELEKETVNEAAWKYETVRYQDQQNPWQLLQERFRKKLSELEVVAIEEESMSYARVRQLSRLLPQNVELVAVDDAIHRIRLIKDHHEVKILREAAQMADEAMQIGVNAVKEGCTELEIVAEIEYVIKKKGIHEMAFQTIVLFGNKTALPHGRPDHTRINPGDLILIDLGVRVKGYCSDLTRTFVFREIQEEQKQIADTVLRAQEVALRCCKPGTPIAEIDLAARTEITKAGWGEYFIHRTGHGLGLGIHEYPSIHGKNNEKLQSGMVITVEPGIYIPNVGGIRIEDDLLITDGGYEVLTKFPKDLLILG